MNDNILVAVDLHKSFGKGPSKVNVLRGLSLSVRRGEFLAVMGPSGCGKSTLLHVMGLMTPPDRGFLAIDGQTVENPDLEAEPEANLEGIDELAPQMNALASEMIPCSPEMRRRVRARKIGFVFQRFNLISVLSAADNVAISLRVRGLRDDGRGKELFDILGVSHVAHKKPGAMSIGEQQRVAVVRALAHRPALVLADEPTGNLDSENAASLLELFSRIHRECGQTIVMITHSAEAAAYADRTVRMKDGILSEGPVVNHV